MLKALGAFAFGLVALAGVGYLIVRHSEDQEMNKTVDTWLANFKERMQKGAGSIKSFFAVTDQPTTEPGAANV
jgi:uncharacterized membrane-anchored protein YhcB (DUF1043 family)